MQLLATTIASLVARTRNQDEIPCRLAMASRTLCEARDCQGRKMIVSICDIQPRRNLYTCNSSLHSWHLCRVGGRNIQRAKKEKICKALQNA